MRITHGLALVLVVVATACGENTSTSVSPSGGGAGAGGGSVAFNCVTGSLRAVIDGLPWAACAPVLSVHDRQIGVLTIAGREATAALTANVGLSFGLPVPGPGTFPYSVTLAPDTPASATVIVAPIIGDGLTWSADGLNGGSGTITVTSFTGNSAAGTFSFTLVPLASSGATGNKTVTEGAFDVTF